MEHHLIRDLAAHAATNIDDANDTPDYPDAARPAYIPQNERRNAVIEPEAPEIEPIWRTLLKLVTGRQAV